MTPIFYRILTNAGGCGRNADATLSRRSGERTPFSDRFSGAKWGTKRGFLPTCSPLSEPQNMRVLAGLSWEASSHNMYYAKQTLVRYFLRCGPSSLTFRTLWDCGRRRLRGFACAIASLRSDSTRFT